MLGLMKKYRRPLGVIYRESKKIGIDGDDLKRKVSRGVSIFLFDRGIQPIVIRAKNRDVAEEKSFAGETGLFEMSDSSLDDAMLIAIESVCRQDQRGVKSADCTEQHEQANGHPSHGRRFEKSPI